DRDDAYILRLEFPRRLPPSSLADELRLPPEMPDYDFELSLQDGTFVVHGRVTDPQVRKLTAGAPAFPPEFTTRLPLRCPVVGRPLPRRPVTAAGLARDFGASRARLAALTVVTRPPHAADGHGPSDLAREAAPAALAGAGLAPADVDLIVFATMTPAVAFPGS